jgi:hypothetical protein
MKVTLTFDATEDPTGAEQAIRASDAYDLIREFADWLRSELKYKETPADLEAARDRFWELVNEYDLGRLLEG